VKPEGRSLKAPTPAWGHAADCENLEVPQKSAETAKKHFVFYFSEFLVFFCAFRVSFGLRSSAFGFDRSAVS
jgi:hypothetical protein